MNLTEIQDEIYKIKEQGLYPVRIYMKKEDQIEIALSLYSPVREGVIPKDISDMIHQNGLIELFGIPVTTADAFAITSTEYKSKSDQPTKEDHDKL